MTTTLLPDQPPPVHTLNPPGAGSVPTPKE